MLPAHNREIMPVYFGNSPRHEGDSLGGLSIVMARGYHLTVPYLSRPD